MNKKASGLFDIYIIFIFIIICTIFAGIALFTLNEFNTQWNAEDSIGSTSKDAADNYTNLTNDVLDGGIVFWFVILWMGSLVTSFFLDNSPVWFVIFFLLSILSFFAILPFANIQSDLSESALSPGYSHLPMVMFINNHLAIFMTAYIITVGIALYFKFKMVST